MAFDAQLLLADAKSVIASASAAVLSSVLNFPQGKDHKGSTASPAPFNNKQMYLHVHVEDSALKGSGGAAGMTINIKNKASASSMGSGSTLLSKTFTSISASGTNFPDGTLMWDVAMTPGKIKPFLCLQFLATTKKIKAGKLTAWIDDVPNNQKLTVQTTK